MGIQQKMVGGVTAPLSVSVSPSYLYGIGDSSTVTTLGAATATATGGTGSFAYTWVKVSGGIVNATSPSAAVTQFQGTSMLPTQFRTAVYRCEVSDGLSVVQSINTVTVEIERE